MRTTQAHESLAQSGGTGLIGGAPLVLRQGSYSSSRWNDPLAVTCLLPHVQAQRVAVILFPPDKTAIQCPVNGYRCDLSRALTKQAFHHFQSLRGCDAPDSRQREARGKALSSRRFREAQSAPCSPVDAQRRFAQCSSMMSQCIEESVCCRIVPLPRLA